MNKLIRIGLLIVIIALIGGFGTSFMFFSEVLVWLTLAAWLLALICSKKLADWWLPKMHNRQSANTRIRSIILISVIAVACIAALWVPISPEDMPLYTLAAVQYLFILYEILYWMIRKQKSPGNIVSDFHTSQGV